MSQSAKRRAKGTDNTAAPVALVSCYADKGGDAMNRDKFLLTLLAGIFLFQAAWFTTELVWCWKHGAAKYCPNVSQHIQQNAAAMTATLLALMVGDSR